MEAAMKVLIGGGSQRGLQRALDSCVGLGLQLDYLPSDAEAQVWRRKASRADVAIVRTGMVSHKAWVNVKAFCPRVIPVPENGEAALLRVIQRLAQEGETAWVMWTAPYPDFEP